MNNLKTTILLAALTGLIIAIGYYVGGSQGAFTAFILSAIMNFGSYWFSDKIVLSLYKAKEINASEQSNVHKMVDELIVKMNLPKPRLYIVPMDVPNAFATGRNKNHAAVAFTSGILKLLNEQELKGVIAHELAHIKNKDILISSIAATIAGAISYLAQMAFFAGSIFGGQSEDEGGGNIFGSIALLILAPIVATILHLAVSRAREFVADETGVRAVGEASGLSNALSKLHSFKSAHPLIAEPKYEATSHMFIVNPFKPSLLLRIFSTHPPVEDRIKRMLTIKFS